LSAERAHLVLLGQCRPGVLFRRLERPDGFTQLVPMGKELTSRGRPRRKLVERVQRKRRMTSPQILFQPASSLAQGRATPRELRPEGVDSSPLLDSRLQRQQLRRDPGGLANSIVERTRGRQIPSYLFRQ